MKKFNLVIDSSVVPMVDQAIGTVWQKGHSPRLYSTAFLVKDVGADMGPTLASVGKSRVLLEPIQARADDDGIVRCRVLYLEPDGRLYVDRPYRFLGDDLLRARELAQKVAQLGIGVRAGKNSMAVDVGAEDNQFDLWEKFRTEARKVSYPRNP